MLDSIRRETVVFAVLVAFLGWWLLDLPPARRAVAVAVAVALFVGSSVYLDRWRRRYLENLRDEE